MKRKTTRLRGIYKTKTGYQIRIPFIDQKTGIKKEKNRHVKVANLQEAEKVRLEMLQELKTEKEDPKRIRFGEYALQWSRINAVRLKPSTKDRYINALEMHILPYLGDYYLDMIDRKDISLWLSERAEEGKESSTVNGWFRVLRSLLRDALADGLIKKDPTFRIKTLKERHKERSVLNLAELKKYLDCSKELTPDHYALFCTGFLTGARWGELSALEWSDLDSEEGILSINKSQYKGQVSGTKTGPIRILPLHPLVLEALKEHRQHMFKNRHPGIVIDLIFPARVIPSHASYNGYRMPSSIRKSLDLVCEVAQIKKRLTPHSMRWTFNNLLRQAKIDFISIQAMTGHSSDAMTEHYSNVSVNEKRSKILTVFSSLKSKAG